MASSFVFYKFKSQREPSRIAFDGTSITVFDLKKEIIAENKMGKGADFDFAIYHADTEEGRQRSIDSLHHRRLVRFDTLVPWGLLRQPLLPFPYPLLCAFDVSSFQSNASFLRRATWRPAFRALSLVTLQNIRDLTSFSFRPVVLVLFLPPFRRVHQRP